jgi:hypothetical protein
VTFAYFRSSKITLIGENIKRKKSWFGYIPVSEQYTFKRSGGEYFEGLR